MGMPTQPGDYAVLDMDQNFCLYVTDATGDRALAGNSFVQSGPMLIDSQVASALKIKPYTIQPGNYPILHDGKSALVVFKSK